MLCSLRLVVYLHFLIPAVTGGIGIQERQFCDPSASQKDRGSLFPPWSGGEFLGFFCLLAAMQVHSLAMGIGIQGIGKGALSIACFPRSKSHEVQQGLCQ